MTASSENLFISESSAAPIGIIAMNSVTELGNKIDGYLTEWSKLAGYETDSYLIECECPRFSSGDGKGLIKSTVRGIDLFIILDVGNYSIKYDYFGMQNAMSPDDHFQDLKRIIQAASGKAHRITVIMPTLFRNSRLWVFPISLPLTLMTPACRMQFLLWALITLCLHIRFSRL